jgi:hypothetical protein
MRNRETASDAQDVLAKLSERKRLLRMVSALVAEVERLQEDNSQLRAAAAMYRAALQRTSAGQAAAAALPAIPLPRTHRSSDTH